MQYPPMIEKFHFNSPLPTNAWWLVPRDEADAAMERAERRNRAERRAAKRAARGHRPKHVRASV